MSTMLSARGYARHRRAAGLQGGTLRAVQKAIAAGRITTEKGGRVNPQTADQQWADRTRPHVFSHVPRGPERRAPGGSKPRPPVIAAYFVVLKRLNRLERAINACLAEVGELAGADTQPATRWKALFHELEALGHRDLPHFQGELYGLARQVVTEAP